MTTDTSLLQAAGRISVQRSLLVVGNEPDWIFLNPLSTYELSVTKTIGPLRVRSASKKAKVSPLLTVWANGTAPTATREAVQVFKTFRLCP